MKVYQTPSPLTSQHLCSLAGLPCASLRGLCAISVDRGVDQRRGPAVRGKGRLVHGALETLTHTTQQVTTHSSEPHPQASGVVPSSHTMRWLLAVSCLSLSRAVPIPTSPITPAPETRVPPTLVPLSCTSLLYSPLIASIPVSIHGKYSNRAAYSECWTFQCVGTVEVTFSNIAIDNRAGRVTLQNNDGYVLTSLVDNRERYMATYPANGEMMVVFNDTGEDSYYYENVFTFEWECHTGPAVVPAAGFDASTYLTLPPAGSYERMFSEHAMYSWIIPCTEILEISASVIPSSSRYSSPVHRYGIELALMNSNGTVVYSHWGSSTVNGIFSVAGNFNITLHTQTEGSYDSEMVFAWSCGRPLPCETLSSPPLVASIQVTVSVPYSECWTFQCVGTVEVTFSNISIEHRAGRVSLQNSDGYVLTSLMGNRERYIATYPANGEMMVVFNDTRGDGYNFENEFTFEWECNTGPAVVPAAGFDASTYLTLPPAGSYKRMFSEYAMYSWIIPCTGTLEVSASVIPTSNPYSSPVYRYGIELALMNSNGTVVYSHWGSSTVNGIFSVAGNFNITLRTRTEGYYNSEMVFAWSCRATTPLATDLPTIASPPPSTPAPDTALPTVTPTDLPTAASSSPSTPAPDTALPTATPTDLPATVPLQPEESGGSSNVVLYVGIGVGVLVVAVCVSVAFHCLQKKPPAKELENHSEMRSREGVAEDTESEDRVELALSEVTVKCEEDVELYRTGEEE